MRWHCSQRLLNSPPACALGTAAASGQAPFPLSRPRQRPRDSSASRPPALRLWQRAARPD
eukprot:15484575-Alexandrium_andersonii.AAC.1